MRRLENTARQEFWEGWVEDGSLLCTRIGPTGGTPALGALAGSRAPTLGVPGGIQMERFATAAGAEAALVGRVAERLGGGWIEVPLRTLLPENDEPSGDWPTGDWISGEPASNQWSAGARTSTDLGDVRQVPGLDVDEDADPDAETEEAARAGRAVGEAEAEGAGWDRMEALFHASRAMSRIPPSADDDEVTVRGPAIPMTRPVRTTVVHPDGSTPGSTTSPGWSPPGAQRADVGARAPIEDPRDQAVEDLEMSVRTTNALLSARITTIGQAAAMSEDELLRLPNFGRKSLVELRSILDELGIARDGESLVEPAPPTDEAAPAPRPFDDDDELSDDELSDDTLDGDDDDELSDDSDDSDDADDDGDALRDDDVSDPPSDAEVVQFAFEEAPTVLDEPTAPPLPRRMSARLAGATEVAAAVEALNEVLDSRRHRSWHHARARRRARRALARLGGVALDDHPELREALEAVLGAEGAGPGVELLAELDAATFAQVARRWGAAGSSSGGPTPGSSSGGPTPGWSPGITDPARRLLAAIVAEVPDPELALQLGVALTDRRTPDRVVLARVRSLRAAADVLLAPSGRSFDGVIALLSSPDPLFARRLADLRG